MSSVTRDQITSKDCIPQILFGPFFIISMLSYIFQKNLQNNWKQTLLSGIIWNI